MAAATHLPTLAAVMTKRIAVPAPVDVVDVGNDIRTALHRFWFFDGDTIRAAVDSLHDRRVAEKTAWAAPGAVKVEIMLEGV